MVEKVKENVQLPAAFLEYYVDGTENRKHCAKHIDFNEQLAGFSKTIDFNNVCKNHDIEQLRQQAHDCIQAINPSIDSNIPKEALFSILTQELLASSLMHNLRTWAWANLELKVKSDAKANEHVHALEAEWTQNHAHFYQLNPLLMLKAWSFYKQGQLHFNLECETLAHHIEQEILSVFKLCVSNLWLDEFIAYVKKTFVMPKLTRELLALVYDQMVPSVMPLLRSQFRQILRQEELGKKPLLLIYPHGKSGVMMLVMNKHGEMIDESMIYPFAPDYDEEQALIHFSKLMMKYPNEHVVWMIKSETRKPIQSLLDKFQQRYPDLPWTLHGIPNLLSHLLVKTKTPQTEDVIKIGLFAQRPAEILASINCLDLISPLFKNLPHAQIQDLWTSLLQEYLLFSGLDIQKAPPALLKAAQLFSHEEIKKIVDSRATHPFKSKACLQTLLAKSAPEFIPISAFIRVENSNNEFDNSFFLNDDKEYIESLCQQLDLHHIAELLNYPTFKLKALETPQLNRLKKLLHIYQQFNKHPAIYNKKTYPILEQIPKHHTFFGLVTKIMPYGAFIDLGYGLEGLLHHSTFIHGLTTDPKLMLNEGDVIKVEWLHYDANQKRLSLKYHGDYFIPKTEMPKKTLVKPQKEHPAKNPQKISANQHKKESLLNNTPTAMALAFAKLKEPPSNNK